MRMTVVARYVLALGLSALLSACGVMFSGTEQDLEINSIPPGATARIGDKECKTPCMLKVSRKTQKVEITAGGFSKEFPVTRTTRAMSFFLDMIAFWPVSLPIDFSTGGVYDLLPVNAVLPSDVMLASGLATRLVGAPLPKVLSDIDDGQ